MMRSKFVSGMSAVILLLCGSCGGARYPISVPGGSTESLNNALDSVVALVEISGEDMGTTCSAFYISETDLITAGHCVLEQTIDIRVDESGINIEVTMEEPDMAIGRVVHFVNRAQYNEWLGQSEEERADHPEHYSATVLAVISPEEDNDMALLRINEGVPPSSHWLPIRDWTEDAPDMGEDVYALGMPVGEPWVLTRGIISRIHVTLDNRVFIYHDARIGPGSSGSPLLDIRGNVIGVNTQISRSNIFSKATPSTSIRTLYSLYEARREIEELDRRLEVEEVE